MRKLAGHKCWCENYYAKLEQVTVRLVKATPIGTDYTGRSASDFWHMKRGTILQFYEKIVKQKYKTKEEEKRHKCSKHKMKYCDAKVCKSCQKSTLKEP